MYCYATWKQTKGETIVSLPEGTEYLVLAEPGAENGSPAFALLECPSASRVAIAIVLATPDDAVVRLIESAKHFPPALALARDELAELRFQTVLDFDRVYGDKLREHLRRQPTTRCFLAEAAQDTCGYKYSGEYYWIVGYRDGMVRWVSRDYWVYEDPREDFSISETLLGGTLRDSPARGRLTLRCSRRQPLLRRRRCYDLACGWRG